MAITTEQIKELREATGAGILDCRKALEQADGDFDKALDFLREKGLATAAKRADREASEGVVELYSHGNGRVGVMVEVNCETDFVGRSEAFRTFAHEVALQIAAAAPHYIREGRYPGRSPGARARDLPATGPGRRQAGSRRSTGSSKVASRNSRTKSVLLRQPYIRDETHHHREAAACRMSPPSARISSSGASPAGSWARDRSKSNPNRRANRPVGSFFANLYSREALGGLHGETN